MKELKTYKTTKIIKSKHQPKKLKTTNLIIWGIQHMDSVMFLGKGIK